MRWLWYALMRWSSIANILLCSLLISCGGKASYNTPVAVIMAFDKAMKRDDAKSAAELFAYDEIARMQNRDWDQFAPSQRQLIISKLKGQKMHELQGWKQHYKDAKYSIGTVQQRGDHATVVLSSSQGNILVTCIQTDEGWRILSIAGIR